MKYGIIGSGRAARHFKHYLDLLGISPTTPEDSDVLLVLISDSAIESYIRDLPPILQNKKLIHFSGCLSTPLAQSFHPLMSFGPDLFTKDSYERIPFVVEKGKYSFKDIFPNLPNPHFEITSEMKPYYHALCVMAGNFTTLLWQKFFKEIETKLGIPKNNALPYFNSIIQALQNNPEMALTGPFSRGDMKTIEQNLSALKQNGDPFERVYSAFKEIYANRS
jgi:2-dehydropantoate 2-reductase